MQISRGNLPVSVERPVSVEFGRDEILRILTKFAGQKLPADRVTFDDIEVIASDDAKLEKVTISGTEVVPLTWKDTSVPPSTTVVAVPNNDTLVQFPVNHGQLAESTK